MAACRSSKRNTKAWAFNPTANRFRKVAQMGRPFFIEAYEPCITRDVMGERVETPSQGSAWVVCRRWIFGTNLPFEVAFIAHLEVHVWRRDLRRLMSGTHTTICTVLASVLLLTACATDESASETKQELSEVFPEQTEQRGISSIERLPDGSHVVFFRSQSEPLPHYVRKYAAYCIRSGKSVPVKVTDVSLSSSVSPRVVSAKLNCQ